MAASQSVHDGVCVNAWSFLEHLYDKGGIGVLSFLFIAFVFYKLVWKVWSAAMTSKDREIERLISERNYLQSRVFPDRETTDSEDEER